MKLALDLIDEDAGNVRVEPADPAADRALAESMKAIGQIAPIEVRGTEDGQRYVVVFGGRRLHAARALGWGTIEATVTELPPAEVKLRQAAENMVREQMEPVDTWLALRDMVQKGHSLTHASLALGLSDRRAAQLMRLSRMHAAVIQLVRKHGVPDDYELRVIAAAPMEAQEKAVHTASRSGTFSWSVVAANCLTLRISQLLAIFDVKKSGLLFDQDMFAEPGSSEEFTTTDVEKFLELQSAALAAKVAKEVKKGFNVEVGLWDKKANYGQGDIAVPSGWSTSYGAKKPKKDEPRKQLLAVCSSGYGIGSIKQAVIAKSQTSRAPAPRGSTASQPGGSAAPPAPPRTMTQAGLDFVARAKTEAVRATLEKDWNDMESTTLLRLLLLAIAGDNVQIHADGRTVSLTDVTSKLLGEDGAVKYALDGPDPRQLAADVLGRMTVFGGPKTDWARQSGALAETIGYALAAERHLPRFDHEEFLGSLSSTALKRLASDLDVATPTKTASALRGVLSGALPTWRPEAALFKPQPIGAVRAAAGGDAQSEARRDDEDEQAGDEHPLSEAAE